MTGSGGWVPWLDLVVGDWSPSLRLIEPGPAVCFVQAASRIVGQATANLRRALAGEPVVDVVNGVAAQVVRRGGG